MKLKVLLASVVIAGFVTPVLADDGYWVVQDETTHKCTIVKEKPTSSSSIKILGVTVFKSETEASGYMKKEKVCTSD
jgi:hypothetical protein